MIHCRALAGAFALATALALPVNAQTLVETPTLDRTHSDLPPVAERIPSEPLVVDLQTKGRTSGTHGGDLRTVISRAKDVRLINVWGYSRIVGYDDDFNLVPDIAQDVEVQDGRVFTIHLREGHRWSDGAPFTAEDMRYFYEEVINNPELTPNPPPFLLVEGELPTFEVLDENTVRYAWERPNPNFLPTLAQARPPFIYRPAHYLKQFNPKFGDAAAIEKMVKAARVRSWAPLHNLKDEMYSAQNPDIPSLQPWVPAAGASDRRVTMVRNPFFHRITTEGHQLPYVDRVIMEVVDGSLIATKVQAGEVDLQARGLTFSDMPVLKRGEEGKGYTVRLWPESKAAAMAIYPNLTVSDPVLRELFRDRRFREALNIGMDRNLLNKALFFGLGEPSANLVLQEAALADVAEGIDFEHNPDRANALLDEIGLSQRNKNGVRLLPDGRALELIIETAGEDSAQIDMLELVKDNWKELGIAVFPRPSQRDVLRNRAFSGELAMSVWSGFDNGLPSADMPPNERVPMGVDFLIGPAWGAYTTSGGESGEEPDFPPVVTLLDAFNQWETAENPDDREAAWETILRTHADEVLTLGTVQGVIQPVVVKNNLRNVPLDGIYGWDPGAQYGIHRMDEFYFENGGG